MALEVDATTSCTNDTLDEDRNEIEKNNGILLWTKLESLSISKKKLLVLDLNGLLIQRAHKCNKSEIPLNRRPDGVYGQRLVYRRPFLEEFLKFCLERFEVGIWSSAKESNVDGILECAFKGLRSSFLFVWDQNKCSDSGFKSLEKKCKPIFFKELKKLWQISAPKRGEHLFSESNTLLIDDEPYKGLLNPPNTGIFPRKYDARNLNDDALDPKRELCSYLKGLADAEDVPSYVKAHPFGQPAIDSQHPNWDFYSLLIRRAGASLV
ncbi:uncharacterized protein LOC104898504 [Beta vulgaris subsp. vulgaris]|uniref:uncharacterized protein LOC104898504 n=1 Tax=Beta vulgaris subsp. vulgaris TaxID=3555 RepID=UPI00203740B6|nr:uncharacterized protein LOC104898504 [Beta vulgaris subsp. vulgaris]